MSDGGMAEPDGSPRPHRLQEGSRAPSMTTVAFVPPPREQRGSISSASDVALSVGAVSSDNDLPFPDFVPISLGFLTQQSRFRFICLSAIQNPWFERISMIVILLNCVTLGMYQPCIDDTCETYRCQILSKFDDAIFAFFTIEMMVKMIAMGVLGKGAFLADTWNRLDCFIVLAGALEYCLAMESSINLSAIRTIRVLRPLRAINRIPSMRILVMLLLDTLPMLGNVLLLCFFVFFIFGIVGVQLWKGMLRQRCFLPDNLTHLEEPITNYYNVTEQEKDFICTLPKDNGMHTCDIIPPSRHKETGAICNDSLATAHLMTNKSCVNWNQYYTECKPSDINPFQGAISFDNIGLAWVAIFLVISLEGWTDIMYYIQDAHSFWDWIYFVLLIVIGSFFMINLCLVVIATQFSETKKREIERMKQERARYHSTSTIASGSMSEQLSCYAEIIKYLAHLYRRARSRLRVKYIQYKKRWIEEKPPKKLSLRRKKRKKLNEVPQGPIVSYGENTGGSVIVPRGHFTSGPLSVYNKTGAVPPPNIITPPEIHEPLELQINIPPTSTENPDFELSAAPQRPGLLQIPSCGIIESTTNGELLSPSPPGTGGANSPRRRRSSVMFSEVILLHGHPGDSRNVCLSEKTTQTEPEEPLDPSVFLSNPPPKNCVRASPMQEPKGNLTCGELLALSGALSAALPAHMGVDAQSVQTLYSSLAKGVKHFSAPSLFYPDVPPNSFSENSSSSESFTDSDGSEVEWSDEEESEPSKVRMACTWMRSWVKKLVEHRYFNRGILIAILINTLSMGVEYHNQPEELTHFVEVSNTIFSALFALEMFLKVVAEGPFGYISNGFNVFDGVIVILSVIEMYEAYGYGAEPSETRSSSGSSGSSLSVLRTFRLLRILKLVRFMPQLRRQLFVMLRTMDNVAIFFSLLILFIFIFSILGMNLFGCKFCTENSDNTVTCDRKNFDSLLWASITVFQILTQEDWNVVLFNGMEKTTHWASLYFVALMTFGNYVLFNLLVAILVEGFSAERNERIEKQKRNKERQRQIDNVSKNCSQNSMSQYSSGENNKNGSWKIQIMEDDTVKNLQLEDRSIISSEDDCSLSSNYSKSHISTNSETLFKEEKKRSGSSLENGDDEKNNVQKTNEEREKENQLRQILLYDEPKCNIEKENQLLQLPRCPNDVDKSYVASTSHLGSSNTHLGHPPIITHTAATPQGSPHTTLDSSRGLEISNRLSPTMALYSSSCLSDESSQNMCRSSSIRSTSASPLRSPRYSGRLGSVHVIYRRQSLSPHDINHSSGRISPTGSFRDRSSSGGTSWQRSSSRRKRVHSTSSNGSKKHNDCQSLVPDSGSDQEEETTLNNNVTFNNNNLNNNLLPTHSGVDHSHCNGSMGIGGSCGAPRRSILTQQNSIGSPRTLSPQNSIRSKGSFRARHHSFHGQSSIYGISKESKECKTTNLEAAARETHLEPECTSNTEYDLPPKLCWILDPPGFLLDRKDYALFIFSHKNPIRRLCVFFVNQKWFDSSILVFIGMNCITLAMERPNIPPGSGERIFLNICNDIFTIVFGLEMLVKVIAQGLLYGSGAYFSSGWNIMDGTLVLISVVDILMSLIDTNSHRIFGILRVFRLLRALRPLRVINRAPGLKLVVQTLLSSLQPIGNIVLICCTFFVIFGILGVQLFKGSFYYCEGPAVIGVETREDCEADDRNDWINQKYNFDNLGQALMALFVLSSKDGWVNIMYTGLDAVGVDKQPQKNYSQWRLLYFISFLLLVGFFVLNMFVGVVVENFHRCREEQEKEERARRAAKRAKKIEKKRRKLREPPYYINYSRTRLFIYNMVTSKYFDLAIAAVIGLNVVTMALEHYEMPQELEYALQIFNYFFTAVFILESVMKVVALGCKRYITDKWNQLDILIVILSVVGIVLEEMKSDIIPINPTIIRVMRMLRIARVLKLLKMAKGIRALLDTVMQALPQVGNLGLLFFLLFFIFAALGVELFGRLECDEKHPCQGLGEHAHFKNFGMAFLTLFRVATGDNWNGIMKDTLRDECNDSDDCVKNCCLYPFVAPIFFVIFVLMAQFVLVNVVVAVLMKHLEESHKQMEDEYDMDVEIERQIAQEEEDIAEMQENISNMKLAQEKLKAAANNNNEEALKNRKHFMNLSSSPVCKVPFFPETLALRGHRGSDPGNISYYRGSPIASDFYHRKDDVSLVIPSININDKDLRRRDSVQIAIIPKERRNPLIQRAQSMSRDDRLPPFPRYRVEVRQRASTSSERKTSSPLPPEKKELKNEKENLSRKNSAPTPPKGLTRDGSAKRVTIDASAKTNDANSSSPGVSPRCQKQRQLNWHKRRKSSSGSYKISMDDSISQSLMASFEISGRVDVDSTSCSVCSSEDVSNMTSSLGNSPRNYYCPSPRVLARYNASEASLSDSLPHCPEVPLDEEEATLASSNDSFATDTVPPEFSGDSSSLSEAAANLPVPPSPRLPRRHDRQVRSLHGLRPRPRPVVSREPLSSSLNELPQYQRRSSPLPQQNNTSTAADSAPQSPNLARRDTNRSSNSDCGVPYTRRISGEFHQEPRSFHSS